MLIKTSGKKVIDMLEVNLSPPNKDCRLNQLLIVRGLNNLLVDEEYRVLEIGLILNYLGMFVYYVRRVKWQRHGNLGLVNL